MTTDYQLGLQDYLLVARRKLPYLISAFVVVLVISTIVAIALPPTYRSSAVILVESPQLITDVNTALNPIEEQISHIEDRVMTRESLLSIANKYKLFAEDKTAKTTTALYEKMKDRISVGLIGNNPNIDQANKKNSAPASINNGTTSISFILSYDDRHPEIAYQVAKDLTALFLDWNAKLRSQAALDKSSFLSTEADKLKAEVDKLDNKILDFKRVNGNDLPEQLALLSGTVSRAESDYYEVDREIQSGNDELRTLQTELAIEKNSMGGEASDELPKLKTEYAKLSAIYTQSHPDVIALKNKIASLESANNASEPPPVANPKKTATLLQTKIDSLQARIASLTKQKAELKIQLAQNAQAVAKAPRVKQELDMLTRDRDNAQRKYEEIYGKSANAQITANLESENISGRFTLIEPPVQPDESYKPNRPKIFLIGFFLAIAAPGALVMALATFDGQIRGANALSHVLGYQPLVVIPYLYIQEEELRFKRNIKRVIILLAITFIVALIAINFLYMPLDQLFMKILGRLG